MAAVTLLMVLCCASVASIGGATAGAGAGGTRFDRYPSRTGAPSQWIDRDLTSDPIVANALKSDPDSLKEALTRYEADGYVVIPQLFTADEVAEIKKVLAIEVATSKNVIRENGNLRSLYDVHILPTNHTLRRLTNEQRLVELAERIVGGAVYIHQTRVNFNFPMTGQGFGWHSDFETWHTEDGMANMHALSCSVLLDRVDATNGATMFVPGSHRHFLPSEAESKVGMHKEKLGNYALERSPSRADMLRLVAEAELRRGRGIVFGEGDPGDVICFDCNVIHGTNRNMSPFDRTIVFIVYNAVSNAIRAPFSPVPPRPEHFATRDPRFHGVPITPLSLSESPARRHEL